MGAHRQGHRLGRQPRSIVVSTAERPDRLAHRIEHGTGGVADEGGGQRAADDDQGGGGLQEAGPRTAFEQLRADHHADGHRNRQERPLLEAAAPGRLCGRRHYATSRFWESPATSMRAWSEGWLEPARAKSERTNVRSAGVSTVTRSPG